VVIDTVNDVVLGDIGDEIMSTAGVAVRPFWWSRESLEALGLAAPSGGSDTTQAGDAPGGDVGGDAAGVSSTVAGGSVVPSTGGSDGGGSGGEVREETGQSGSEDEGARSASGLSGGWIALIAVLAVVAVAALTGLAFMLGRGRTIAPAQAVDRQAKPSAAFCSQCGSGVGSSAKFCPGCGKPV
jgi:hypothetical protein